MIAEDEPAARRLRRKRLARAARLATPCRSTEAANLFAANRRWMAPILRALHDADFARAGNHTEKGRMTLAEILAYATNHLDHHLRFLYAKRAKLGIALPPRYTSEALPV